MAFLIFYGKLYGLYKGGGGILFVLLSLQDGVLVENPFLKKKKK